MKKLLILFLIIITLNNTYSKDNFNLKPILLDFHGVIGKDSTIIAYGNYGCCLISFDGDKTWETKKIFDFGTINKIFWEEDRIVAFTTNGQIAVSYDNAFTWEIQPSIDITSLENDSYLNTQIVATKKGYVIRKKNNMYFVNKDLKIEKTINETIPNNIHFNYILENTKIDFVHYDGKNIIYPINGNNIKFYDDELNLVDSIDAVKKINSNCDDCTSFRILSNKNNYFVNIYDYNYIVSKDWSKIKFLKDTNEAYRSFRLFKVTDDKIFYRYGINTLEIYTYNLIGDSLDLYYKENQNKLISTFNNEYRQFDYFTIGNKTYVVYGNNTIKCFTNLFDDKPKENKVISLSGYINPSRVKIQNYKDNKILISNSTDFKTNIAYSEIEVNSNLLNLTLGYDSKVREMINSSLNIYDPKNDAFNFAGKFSFQTFGSSTIRTLDKGKTYIINDTADKYIFGIENVYNSFYQKINSKLNAFSISYTNNYNRTDGILQISRNYLLNKDLSLINYIDFRDEFVQLCNFLDTNKILVLVQHPSTYEYTLKYSFDKAINWEIIKEYGKDIEVIQKKDIVINGKEFWVYSYCNYTSNMLYIDLVNIETKEVITVFEKLLVDDQLYKIKDITFDAAKDKFYLSFYNTLMVSSNIFDENIKWETFNYPNNGKILGTLYVYNKTIFARYEDDRNEDNVYWINGIEMVGDPTSVENNIEEVNYLYTLPPYPNPTVSEVTTKFYWDSSIDIDNSEIAVFDITGNKVSGKENLTLEKLNEWSGNIKWNCVGVPKGTYLIKIQHGNNTKTVKVVVD